MHIKHHFVDSSLNLLDVLESLRHQQRKQHTAVMIRIIYFFTSKTPHTWTAIKYNNIYSEIISGVVHFLIWGIKMLSWRQDRDLIENL